jgi:small-conductance mechanosensitive channel
VPLRLEIAEMRLRLAESDRSVAEMAAVHNRVEGEIQGLVNSEDQLRQQVQRVADRLSSFDPLRTEIAEMRQRLAESDRSVLDLILAIGRMCRQAAERITDPAPLPAETAPPPSLTEPPPIATGDSLAPAPEEPQAPLDPPLDSSAPDFTQLKKATSLWRVPLVSSFLLATGSLLMLHYL